MSYSSTNHMDPKHPYDFWTQFWQFIYKYGAWIGWIILGLVGRFSYDLLRHKAFTIGYVLGSTGIAFLIGYVSGVYIFTKYPDDAPILIPMITLVSNNLVSAVMSID